MKTAFAIGALAVLACSSQPASSDGTAGTIQQARAAIQALEDRDRAFVDACERDVGSCFAANADGGSTGACEDLREQCREAKEALAGVRGPAVACWREVVRCAEHGQGFASADAGADAGASCNVTPRDCEALADETDGDRDPILECKGEVRGCLASARQREADWREQCADVREACSEICGLAVRVSREPDRRGGRAQGLRGRVRELISRLHERRHGTGSSGSDGGPDDRVDAGSRW